MSVTLSCYTEGKNQRHSAHLGASISVYLFFAAHWYFWHTSTLHEPWETHQGCLRGCLVAAAHLKNIGEEKLPGLHCFSLSHTGTQTSAFSWEEALQQLEGCSILPVPLIDKHRSHGLVTITLYSTRGLNIEKVTSYMFCCDLWGKLVQLFDLFFFLKFIILCIIIWSPIILRRVRIYLSLDDWVMCRVHPKIKASRLHHWWDAGGPI